jgi:pimeloyl-ACP methyl ester carboxylesterase
VPARVSRCCLDLAASSRMIVIDDAGHFLHLEKPGEVNDHILTWLG